MKTLRLISLAIAAIAITACCKDQTTGSYKVCMFGNSAALKQAFGIAVRSLEGSALAQDATKIPSAIETLADKWLPAGNTYSLFVRNIINSYIAAHPVTVDQVNKVLESIAMQVQTNS